MEFGQARSEPDLNKRLRGLLSSRGRVRVQLNSLTERQHFISSFTEGIRVTVHKQDPLCLNLEVATPRPRTCRPRPKRPALSARTLPNRSLQLCELLQESPTRSPPSRVPPDPQATRDSLDLSFCISNLQTLIHKDRRELAEQVGRKQRRTLLSAPPPAPPPPAPASNVRLQLLKLLDEKKARV